MPAVRKVSEQQLNLLLTEMEADRDFALARVTLTGDPLANPQTKQLAGRKWEALASRLNAVGVGSSGCKSALQWKSYWLNLKYSAKRKAAYMKHAQANGRPINFKITPMEKRVLSVLGVSIVPAQPTQPKKQNLGFCIVTLGSLNQTSQNQSSQNLSLQNQTTQNSSTQNLTIQNSSTQNQTSQNQNSQNTSQNQTSQNSRTQNQSSQKQGSQNPTPSSQAKVPQWAMEIEQRHIEAEERMASAMEGIAERQREISETLKTLLQVVQNRLPEFLKYEDG